MRTLVAYVPVLHEGYRRFFTKHKGPKELYLFGPEITVEFSWLAKEIRQLDAPLMKRAVESLDIFEKVSILNKKNIKSLAKKSLVLPDEDVSRQLAEKYFPNASVRFDPLFLRWDKHNSIQEKKVTPAERLTRGEFHRRVMAGARRDAEKSSDIWRHVGGAIVKNKKVVLTGYNRHLPSEHSPYVNGDPRNNFHKGDHIEIATAFHVEASLIAEAAKKGIKLEGADMYVTTFPCPPCAKVIAHSGIKNLYCGGGYGFGVLDTEAMLKSRGVKIIFVE